MYAHQNTIYYLDLGETQRYETSGHLAKNRRANESN